MAAAPQQLVPVSCLGPFSVSRALSCVRRRTAVPGIALEGMPPDRRAGRPPDVSSKAVRRQGCLLDRFIPARQPATLRTASPSCRRLPGLCRGCWWPARILVGSACNGRPAGQPESVHSGDQGSCEPRWTLAPPAIAAVAAAAAAARRSSPPAAPAPAPAFTAGRHAWSGAAQVHGRRGTPGGGTGAAVWAGRCPQAAGDR